MRTLSMLVLLFVVGCSPTALQIQAHTANDLAIAANDALPRVIQIYTAEGAAVIQAAPDRATAETQLEQVRARWQRVWGTDPTTHGSCHGFSDPSVGACVDGAYNGVRAAHDLWARLLEQQIAGHPLNLSSVVSAASSLRDAYCGLRSALPDNVQLPDPPASLACNSSH